MVANVLFDVFTGLLIVFCITVTALSIVDWGDTPMLNRFKAISDKVFNPIRKILPFKDPPFDLAPLIVLLFVYTISRILFKTAF